MAEAYRGDIDLMENLGLDWQKPFRREWTDLGTVKLYDDEPLPTIKVEVSALPAQFFRFTVTRKADTVEPAPNEVLVIRTGSGSLATYWPSVRHVAQNCFDVTTVGRYRAIRPSRAGGQPVTVYEETSGDDLCSMCESSPATTTWGLPVCQDCADGLDSLQGELRAMEEADPELARLGERAEEAMRRYIEAGGPIAPAPLGDGSEHTGAGE